MNDFNYIGRISRKLLGQYALSLFGSLGVLAFLAGGSVLFFGTFHFWRNSVILTYILYFCRDYLPLLFLLCLGGCWLGCTVHFIRKPLDYLDEMVEAAEQLTQPDGEPILLSPELSILEEHLNWAQSKALRDQRAAREAEQRKNDLVVYLAHDLKTPLTSVLGYLQLLRDEPGLSEEQRSKYTGIALDKARRLEELVGEFFDITTMDLTLQKHDPVQISFLLEQLADEFYPLFAAKELRCEPDIEPHLVVEGDGDKLARVFDNVLRNAVNYSAPGGPVGLMARREGERAVVTVSNLGLEIPEKELANIFEKFYRLDAARSTSTGGAGLGLAIAKEIVELHGGTIRAESNGARTAFVISLPLEG